MFVILIKVVLRSFQDGSPKWVAFGRVLVLKWAQAQFRQVAEAVTPHLLSGKFFQFPTNFGSG
jgi:hypothetical protein